MRDLLRLFGAAILLGLVLAAVLVVAQLLGVVR